MDPIAQALAAMRAAEYEFTCLEPRLSNPFSKNVHDLKLQLNEAIRSLQQATESPAPVMHIVHRKNAQGQTVYLTLRHHWTTQKDMAGTFPQDVAARYATRLQAQADRFVPS